jgi:hypothetical protein
MVTMKTSTKIVITVIIVAIIAAGFILMMWLFGRYLTLAGLGYIVLIPALIIGTGVAIFYLLRASFDKHAIFVPICILFTILVLFIEVAGFPVDGGVGKIIDRYWDVFQQYPNGIEYKDLVYGNNAEITAAMLYYSKDLPEKILVIEISLPKVDEPKKLNDFELSSTYLVNFRDGSLEFDASQIIVENSGKGTKVILNQGTSLMKEYYTDTDLKFMMEHPGISEDVPSNGARVYFRVVAMSDRLVNQSGADKVLTFLVEHFK